MVSLNTKEDDENSCLGEKSFCLSRCCAEDGSSHNVLDQWGSHRLVGCWMCV